MMPARPATESFGGLLRRYRTAAGLTQEELAERAGLSARGISDLERGVKTRPHFETVRLLGEALALPDDDRAELLTAARPGHLPPLTATTRLPTPPTPLVGREAAVAAAVEVLRQRVVRILTLTGPGGVGKTRLALEVAALVGADFAGGVVWIDLAPLPAPDLVLPTIAHAVGVQETGGAALADLLADRLRERDLLLVLDNIEHVLPAAPAVAGLLAACPGLTMLATGRERLRVRGEREQPVEPLALPDPGSGASAANLADVEAVRFFVERAADIQPGFALTPANAAAIAAICRRLDGLPLALELAAAWSKVLSPAALLRRLDAEPLALPAGARDLPARQHTLRATVAWSHDLLTLAEQALFRRLAVFAGGFGPDAVVATAPGTESAALEVLAGLIDKSLIVRREQADGDPRLGMLETIREFGFEQLAASGEEQTVRSAHAAFYLALAEEARAGLAGERQVEWLARLEAEHDNLRAALRWLLDRADGDRALRLAGSLWWYWLVHGHLSEGRSWLTATLAVGGAAVPALRGRALTGAGLLAETQGDLDAATTLQEEALALFRATSDQEGAARALGSLGSIAFARGDYGQATALHDEALGLWRQLDDRHGAAYALIDLGIVANRQGDAERGGRQYAEALHLLRAVGDQRGVAVALTDLGDLEALQGDADQATVRYDEALKLWHELGDKEGAALVLANLGEVERLRGNLKRATTLLTEALSLFQVLGARHRVASTLAKLGFVERAVGHEAQSQALLSEALALAYQGDDKAVVARCLEGLAGLALAHGAIERSGRLFGAAAALREAIGAPLPAPYRAELDCDLATAEAAGGKAFAAARSASRRLPLEAAIAEVNALSNRRGNDAEVLWSIRPSVG